MTEKWRLVNQPQNPEEAETKPADNCHFIALQQGIWLSNNLLHDLVVLHPLMLREDQTCQVIRRTEKKLSQIIRQDYVCWITDEWKIYQGQEISEDWYITEHQGDGSNTYQKLIITGKECPRRKNSQAHHTIMSCQSLGMLTLPSHDNAGFERSLVGEQQSTH